MGNLQLTQGGGMLPMNRRISNIFAPDYVDETFLLMSNEWKVIMRNITNALLSVDSSPTGTDLTSLPAAADLKAELLNMHTWFMQQQTRGGINLLQEFMLWLYNQVGTRAQRIQSSGFGPGREKGGTAANTTVGALLRGAMGAMGGLVFRSASRTARMWWMRSSTPSTSGCTPSSA